VDRHYGLAVPMDCKTARLAQIRSDLRCGRPQLKVGAATLHDSSDRKACDAENEEDNQKLNQGEPGIARPLSGP